MLFILIKCTVESNAMQYISKRFFISPRPNLPECFTFLVFRLRADLIVCLHIRN